MAIFKWFQAKVTLSVLLKSDKRSEQSGVISYALPSLARTPLISHPDNSWIVLAARIGVCKAGVLR